MFHGLANKTIGTGATALVLVCGLAFAALHTRVPERDSARESLDLLKTLTAAGAAGQSHVSSCISSIAGAIRVEARDGAGQGSVRRTWHDASEHCAVLLRTLCEAGPALHEHEACRDRGS